MIWFCSVMSLTIFKVIVGFCGYSKEQSWRNGSNEYPQHMFWLNDKIKKKNWLKYFSYLELVSCML